MALVGKRAVTRDDSGELAFPLDWPWYWRYTGAILLAVIGLIASYIAAVDGQQEWVQWALGMGAAFFALCIAFEFGPIALVLALFGGIWLVSEAFFPDFSIGQKGAVFIVGCFAYYAWWVANEARIKAEQAMRVGKKLWERLNQIDEGGSDRNENVHEELYKLRARVRELERSAEVPLGPA